MHFRILNVACANTYHVWISRIKPIGIILNHTVRELLKSDGMLQPGHTRCRTSTTNKSSRIIKYSSHKYIHTLHTDSFYRYGWC